MVQSVFKQIKLFKIDRGLYTHKVIDHYAVLGIPLTTVDSDQFRSKYLQLARILHPDLSPPNSAYTEIAEKYLAKLVNPAYKVLFNERDRREHLATLKLLGQRLKFKGETPDLQCELAIKLLKYPHEQTYIKYFAEIASRQYAELDRVLDRIADLSELNLVYVMTQELDFLDHAIPAPSVASPKVSPAYRNIQLAELFISKKQWAEALKELKSAEKLDPENANIFVQMGLVYLNQNITALAKSNFQKALKLDPTEPSAAKYLKQMSTPATKQPPQKDQKKGGFFGWGKK